MILPWYPTHLLVKLIFPSEQEINGKLTGIRSSQIWKKNVIDDISGGEMSGPHGPPLATSLRPLTHTRSTRILSPVRSTSTFCRWLVRPSCQTVTLFVGSTVIVVENLFAVYFKTVSNLFRLFSRPFNPCPTTRSALFDLATCVRSRLDVWNKAGELSSPTRYARFRRVLERNSQHQVFSTYSST